MGGTPWRVALLRRPPCTGAKPAGGRSKQRCEFCCGGCSCRERVPSLHTCIHVHSVLACHSRCQPAAGHGALKGDSSKRPRRKPSRQRSLRLSQRLKGRPKPKRSPLEKEQYQMLGSTRVKGVIARQRLKRRLCGNCGVRGHQAVTCTLPCFARGGDHRCFECTHTQSSTWLQGALPAEIV